MFESIVLKITILKSSKLLFFIALKVSITIMIESNKEKNICVRFYTADEKLCKYEILFSEKSENQNKLIQSGTPGQHTRNWDCPSTRV